MKLDEILTNTKINDDEVVNDTSIVEGLCEILAGNGDYDVDAFENRPEKIQRFKEFENRYIAVVEDGAKEDEMFSDFLEAIMEARHAAFGVGFKAALKLMREI